jgi:hypothetical protein
VKATLAALWTLTFLTTGCVTSPAPPGNPPPALIERELTLARPTDVRWEGDDHVLIAALQDGIARVSVADAAPPEWLPEWPAGVGPGSRYMYLGTSEKFVVAADLAFGLRWRERVAAGDVVSQPMEYIADLDVQGERLLISGLRRDDRGQLGADGAFAWIGSLPDGTFRAVLPFTNRGLIENCAGFHLTAVRFLRDGGFVIVPGAEPGVFIYDAQAHLQRTFDSRVLNIVTDCDLTRDEQTLLPTNAEARQGWINRHRIVDDVVELGAVPALIVRKRDQTTTRWELVPLGNGETRPIPVTSPSPWAHVSADSRNGRIALLVADQIAPREEGVSPRLIVWRP